MTESHRSTSDVTSESKLGDAAEILWQAWSSGRALESLPRELRPQDLAEGYAVQRALDELAGPPTGWKIAATSQAGQQHLGASGPMVGRLYRSQARSSGASLSVRNMRMRSAEPEFAFVLAQDLEARPGGLERADVLAAVGSLVLAIEVPDSRFIDFKAVGVPSLAADAMCGGHYVCGPAIEEWRSLDLARQRARLLCGGEERSAGSGAAVLGDPRDALTWMANEVLGRGWELSAGEIIMTGASSPPLAVDAGDAIEAVFDGLGSVSVTFTA